MELEVQSDSHAMRLGAQSRSASIGDFQVEKKADLSDMKRSASQPTLRGHTSPVTRLQIEVKTAGSTNSAEEAEASTLIATPENGVPAPQPPLITPSAVSKPLGPPRTRAMCFDFDLTLIPRHTGGMPAPGQALAPGKYLRDLRAHLAGLVRADFDLYIITRGDVRAVRAALSCCHDSGDPGTGLESWFRSIYGASETDGCPITRRAESFTEQDMHHIQSVAPPDAWARLANGRPDAATQVLAPVVGEAVLEETRDAEYGKATDRSASGGAMVGRENAALACVLPLYLASSSSCARLSPVCTKVSPNVLNVRSARSNKCWWAWKKCDFLEQIVVEGGYNPGMVWFADDTRENIVAVDTLLSDRVHTVHVDGAFGRGIVANQAYLDAVEPLLTVADSDKSELEPRTSAIPIAAGDYLGANVDGSALEVQEGSEGEAQRSDGTAADPVALPVVAPAVASVEGKYNHE